MHQPLPTTTTGDTPAATITNGNDVAKNNSNSKSTTKKTPLSRWVFGGGSTSKAQHDGAGADRMPPYQHRLPSTFCATPKPTTSSTSCRTSSPSPRVREGEGVAPSPGFWVRRRSRRASVDRPSTPSGDLGPGGGSAARQQMDTPGFAAIAEEQDSENQAVVADAERKQQQEEQTGRSIWDEFDNSPWEGRSAADGGGRELQRRKCVFKVFVVFRGDWCSTSAVLLKGERQAALLCGNKILRR